MHAMSFLKCALLCQNDSLNPPFPASHFLTKIKWKAFFLQKSFDKIYELKHVDAATQRKHSQH